MLIVHHFRVLRPDNVDICTDDGKTIAFVPERSGEKLLEHRLLLIGEVAFRVGQMRAKRQRVTHLQRLRQGREKLSILGPCNFVLPIMATHELVRHFQAARPRLD